MMDIFILFALSLLGFSTVLSLVTNKGLDAPTKLGLVFRLITAVVAIIFQSIQIGS